MRNEADCLHCVDWHVRCAETCTRIPPMRGCSWVPPSLRGHYGFRADSAGVGDPQTGAVARSEDNGEDDQDSEPSLVPGCGHDDLAGWCDEHECPANCPTGLDCEGGYGGICPPERRRAMAENATPVTAWSPWMWGYVASEDLAILHRLLLEKADSLPMHDVYIANALDTSILEPSREVIARFRPDLLPVLRDMEGHRAFFSTAKAKEAVGWVPTTSWRECLPA